MRRVGLLWFNNDLRISDNATLLRVAQDVDQLICLAIEPAQTSAYDKFKPFALSSHRRRFLNDSLADLDRNLSDLGQQLIISAFTKSPITDFLSRLSCHSTLLNCLTAFLNSAVK